MIVEWALALPLTTAFAGYTSAPVKARPLSSNETMEFRLWSSACFHAAVSGREEKPFVCLNSTPEEIRCSGVHRSVTRCPRNITDNIFHGDPARMFSGQARDQFRCVDLPKGDWLSNPNGTANTRCVLEYDSIYYRQRETRPRVDTRVALAHWPTTRSDATLIANSFSVYWIFSCPLRGVSCFELQSGAESVEVNGLLTKSHCDFSRSRGMSSELRVSANGDTAVHGLSLNK